MRLFRSLPRRPPGRLSSSPRRRRWWRALLPLRRALTNSLRRSLSTITSSARGTWFSLSIAYSPSSPRRVAPWPTADEIARRTWTSRSRSSRRSVDRAPASRACESLGSPRTLFVGSWLTDQAFCSAERSLPFTGPSQYTLGSISKGVSADQSQKSRPSASLKWLSSKASS
jgi:hypothetical protein